MVLFNEAIKNSYFEFMHKGDSMKNNIDLHMHSIYSDGTYTLAELVICARQKGLSAISLTDHDTTDGLREAREDTYFAFRSSTGVQP